MSRIEDKKLGRPRKIFSKARIKRIEEAALLGCQDTTIAGIMEIDLKTLKLHFSAILRKKRQERKERLRKIQWGHAKANVAMAIFLGKNELDQRDRHDVHTRMTLADAFLAVDEDTNG